MEADFEEKKKRSIETSPLPVVKKPRLESLTKPTDGPSIFLQLRLFKDVGFLINAELDKMFLKHFNETNILLNEAKAHMKTIGTSISSAEKHLVKAEQLISFPIPEKFVTNSNHRPNGLHPANITSQNKLLPYPALKEPAVSDGVQIVSCVSGRSLSNLPPSGPIKNLEPTLNCRVYAMKFDLFRIWYRATIVDVKDSSNNEKAYRVKFDGSKMSKIVTAKQMAHEFPSGVRLPFGRRIVAFYRSEDKNQKPALYAGIIAEPPKSTNKHRYLIFFDDGFAQYIEHTDIRLVFAESKDVWEDIHKNSREFIKSYYEKFPERPMLKLQTNQVIKTEFDYSWWPAKVVDVDASMVKMHFEGQERYEWIYRGSTRLAPLYNELEKAKHNRLMGKVRRHNIPGRKGNQNVPYVEYTRAIDEIVLDSDGSDSEVKNVPRKPLPSNTARKSTATAKKPEPAEPSESAVKNYEGEVVCVKEKRQSLPIKYVPHTCSRRCREQISISNFKGENPLRKPMLVGWERHSRKYRPRVYMMCVHYRTPCGKMLRTVEEVDEYLIKVESDLTIDLFSFDAMLSPYKEFVTSKKQAFWSIADVADGRENVPIQCVNCLSSEKPPYVEYAAARYTGKGVNLNLDDEFLCGCDCEDNCQDPKKCQCRQLTIRPRGDTTSEILGYKHRRLFEPIVTGIYECNPRCKCASSCTNRVVQNGIQIRLQMFKTLKKGWGIRCLDDVDAGMFLCIYAGQLMTEQGAEESGHIHGDEYLAELDHIEVVEMRKEGYESEVEGLVEDVPPKIEEKKVEVVSDSESDVSSTKSSSYSSQTSNGQDSDPEYEAPSRRDSNSSTYITRSQRAQSKKRVSLFATSEFESDGDSRSGLEEKYGDNLEKKELPDLDTPHTSQNLDPRPLSPTTAEQIGKLHINRKPKIEELSNSSDSSSVGSKVVNAKKSMSKPLPPPAPLEKKAKEFVSARSYFGETQCYIMNAKTKGNIGRYLNHSCHPNSFVQTVFTDCHDLRFPTVAFFASDHINAGSELTWDYNYEVGSVANKVLYCHCESKNCRGRLL